VIAPRAQWNSKLGFILAGAGAAVGLGNLWKFPYIAGENGGGIFILAYLACVVVIGLPLMAGEIIIGRATQKSPVGAIQALTHKGSFWVGFGWLTILAAASLLSYYSVIAGWAMYYAFMALTGELTAAGSSYSDIFAATQASAGVNLFWHTSFMALTIGVVLGGVSKGLDRWSRILMPTLLIMLAGLVVRSLFLDGFAPGFHFAIGIRPEEFHATSMLAAVGQAFFSLSIGMGTMLTYGSYLKREDDIMGSAVQISALDTIVALMGCLVIFPIIFTYPELAPGQGPGLLFESIPTGMAQMPFAGLLLSVFFLLLVFAALTSAISLLEVPVSFLIDRFGWDRKKAGLVAGLVIFLYGVPSALSGVEGGMFTDFIWALDGVVSNYMFPLSGIGLSLFVGWRMPDQIRHDHFLSGSKYTAFYKAWLTLLRFVVPVGIMVVFLNAIGIV
jgi:NSS family neurotransmitter:Na+ symporter